MSKPCDISGRTAQVISAKNVSPQNCELTNGYCFLSQCFVAPERQAGMKPLYWGPCDTRMFGFYPSKSGRLWYVSHEQVEFEVKNTLWFTLAPSKLDA